MPSLFDNAVASIRMGVEDYKQQDQDRDISAVRNLYAGVLLLAKEAIIRSAPNADPGTLIGSKIKPVPDGAGGVKYEKSGNSTIDFQQITERAKSFGVRIDQKMLSDLNKIRNDMEHHYSAESSTSIRSAISKSFTIIASLFRQISEDPVSLLGDSWTKMLETKELYEQELNGAKLTLSNVAWFSTSIAGAAFKCNECKSELIAQVDPENDKQRFVDLHCITCGNKPNLEDTIESFLEDIYRGDRFSRYKDALEQGPIHQCPACSRNALSEYDLTCATCGEEIEYDAECGRCGNDISLEEYLGGSDEGYCSYCTYMTDKMMRED